MKSTIEISAGALRANFHAIQQVAGPSFEPLCVIKANAYGHGVALCAPVLVEAGAHWLGVGDVEEGILVRNALLRSGLADRPVHVLVMCGFEPGDASALVEHALTPVVWTPAHIHQLEAAAAPLNSRITVHIEVDTGMARQGVLPGADLAALLDVLDHAPHVRAEGFFTHLSSAEVAGSAHTAAQQERFHQAYAQALTQGFLPEIVHLGNSSAIDEGATLPWLRSATIQFGARLLVRPGLALYGYALPLTGAPPLVARLQPQLEPVATWTTRIVGLRDLHPGDTVGYNATFTTPRPMRLALLPTGYADGFRREASSGEGNGWVMIAGQRAPIRGRISMNLTVVDITDHTPAPQLGDGAILLGPGVTAHDHAAWCNTIPYEILCGMRGHHQLTD